MTGGRLKVFLRQLSVRKAPIFLLFLALFGCTNNFSLTTANLANSVQAPTPNSGSNDGNSTFTLSRVVKNSLNPLTFLDLVGDGSGTFGSLCLPSGSSSSNTATTPTVCNCTFSYNSATHPNTQVDTPVTYHETNLLRCDYSGIPSDVTSFDVAVHLTSAGTFSNKVTFSFNGTGNTLDTSNASSFTKVVRYQCRDIVYIPYIFDGSIYDPLQSEDFHLTYPLDFYATNLGNAISTYAAAVGSNANLIYWDCPPVLTPDKYLSPLALANFNSTNHVNLTVYSKAPLSGSKLIYPPQPGIFDRSTFYLATQASGVFKVPVNAYQSPGVITAADSSSPPLGYGATPIPTGSGTETCPDTSIPIPAGYHWVKIWLFRASLAQRHFATTGSQGPSMLQVQSLSCNPGDWSVPPSATVSSIFPGCPLTRANGGISVGFADLVANPTHYLADRVLGTGECVRLDDFSGTLCGTHPGAGCNGADFWTALLPGTPQSANIGCGPSTVYDPLNTCSANSTNGLAAYPYTSNIGTGDLDTGSARYDFLFVVTPPSITVSDMLNTSPSSPSLPYQPYRFYTDLDCLSNDPDNPTSSTDCLASNAIVNYGMKLHDVGNNGDPPADDANRPGVLPVCALQPNS